MNVVIHDTSVLVDLAEGGLLELFFRLGICSMTTSAVVEEIKHESQQQLVEKFLNREIQVCALEGALLIESIQLLDRVSALSIADTSVAVLAKQESAVLLTNDRRLRTHCQSEKIEVRGVLWVLDELLRCDVITPKKARTALDTILERGARLPENEVQLRRARWVII
jgi:predicted nucleic acid-binding protein